MEEKEIEKYAYSVMEISSKEEALALVRELVDNAKKIGYTEGYTDGNNFGSDDCE